MFFKRHYTFIYGRADGKWQLCGIYLLNTAARITAATLRVATEIKIITVARHFGVCKHQKLRGRLFRRHYGLNVTKGRQASADVLAAGQCIRFVVDALRVN